MTAATARPLAAIAITNGFSLRRAALAGLRRHTVGVAVAAAPLIVLCLLVTERLYLSEFHAITLSEALLARSRGRFEILGSAYPPVPFGLTLLWPRSGTLSVISGMIGGIVAYALWRDVGRGALGRPTRLLLVLATIGTPAYLFVMSQRFSELLAVALFVPAWHRFLRFTISGDTSSGFTAGLLLGACFYVSVYAVPLALALALCARLFVKQRHDDESSLPAAVVIAFPPVIALAIWAYLSWMFYGDPLILLHDPSSPLLASSNPEAASSDLVTVVTDIVGEVARSPLFIVMAAVMARRGARWIAVFGSPVAVIALARAAGFAYPSTFALVTLTVLACAALPRDLSRAWRPLLVTAAVAQLGLAWVVPLQGRDQTEFVAAVEGISPGARFRAERELGSALSNAGPRAVLVDNRANFRLIAGAGTAEPFLTPSDERFELAAALPDRAVEYIVYAEDDPDDAVAARFAAAPPFGFVVDTRVAGWTVLRRIDAIPAGV